MLADYHLIKMNQFTAGCRLIDRLKNPGDRVRLLGFHDQLGVMADGIQPGLHFKRAAGKVFGFAAPPMNMAPME